MFNMQLWGGKGNKVAASVTDDQELKTIVAPFPPLSEQKTLPFRQYLTTDGAPTSSNDMTVNGSTTNVDFYVLADQSSDRYIASLDFIIGYGTTGQPNEFCDGTALTNGIKLFYEYSGGEIDIHDGIKSNQDFFRIGFSSVPANWEVRHVNANNDFGYFVSMDLRKLGLPFGIKLQRGTNQRLGVRIRDNVGLDADSLNCITYGFDRFE